MDTTLVAAVIGAAATLVAAWWTTQPKRKEWTTDLPPTSQPPQHQKESEPQPSSSDEPLSITFRDQTTADVCVSFQYRAVHTRKFLMNFGSHEKARLILAPRFRSAAAAVLEQLTLAEFRSERALTEDKVRQLVMNQVGEMGITVDGVHILNVSESSSPKGISVKIVTGCPLKNKREASGGATV